MRIAILCSLATPLLLASVASSVAQPASRKNFVSGYGGLPTPTITRTACDSLAGANTRLSLIVDQQNRLLATRAEGIGLLTQKAQLTKLAIDDLEHRANQRVSGLVVENAGLTGRNEQLTGQNAGLSAENDRLRGRTLAGRGLRKARNGLAGFGLVALTLTVLKLIL